MLEPFDLSGMDLNDARRFVAAHLAALRRTREQRKKQEEELGLWEGRISLADERNRPDLVSEARLRVQEAQTGLERISAEEMELERQVDELKRQLVNLARQPQLSSDAQDLLAHLEAVDGMQDLQDGTADRFREWEADTALQELKKKINCDTDTGTGTGN